MALILSNQVRVASYGDFLNHVVSLIGIELADFQAAELNIINTYFNRAIRKIWEMSNWNDVCPYGEARFPTNLLTYPNDLTQSSYWTLANTTATANTLANPLDNRTTASTLLETGTTGAHGVSQTALFIPTYAYSVSAYVRPNGRSWAYLSVSDGSLTYTGFFNLAGMVTGTIGGTGTCTTNIQNVGNGFYLISMAFTASAGAGTGSIGLQTSPDGSTLSFAGNSSLGFFVWGFTGTQTSSGLPASFVIPWSQLGESGIDQGGLFDIWPNNPLTTVPTVRWTYKPTPAGINLIGCQQSSPTYLYYRYQRPVYTGATYNPVLTYTVGKTIYFTSSTGTINYWTCVVATTAGQSPDTTPSSWAVIPIPYVFLEYCIYNAYADWLQVEGQTAKAEQMYAYAQSCIDDENDKQERQLGNIMPMRVYTHITSQGRAGGYTGTTIITNPNAQ